MKTDIYSKSGEKTGRSVDLPESVFGIEPNEHVMYLDIKRIMAHKRQGTHKSKERGEITSSTRKIKKQKGTGTARAGSIRNPLFRGGGRVFGPRPRDYVIKLNKKVIRLARRSALSQRTASDNLKVLENISFDSPRTKDLLSILQGLDVAKKKTVFVLGDYDNNVLISSRNIPNTNVVCVKDLCTYDILKANSVIMTEGAVEYISKTLS